MRHIPIIYLDTSVWLAFFNKNDKNHDAAKLILDNAIKDDEVIIFYSTLVLLEIIDVIRRKYPEKQTYQGNIPEVRSHIEREIEDRIRIILDRFSRWESSGKAQYVDPEFVKVFDHHRNTLKNLQICVGDVVCDYDNDKYKYKGPGNDDVQHALIASDCSVKKLFSADRGFEKFITMNDFQALTITVI